jgi:hypothetical protein
MAGQRTGVRAQRSEVRRQTVFRNVNSKWREKGKPDFRVQFSEFRSEQEVGGKENEFSDFRVQF